jgi:hypothetical protein
MDNETKLTLAWVIPSVILILGIVGLSLSYNKAITTKFIENGYHEEQKIGSDGVIWVK